MVRASGIPSGQVILVTTGMQDRTVRITLNGAPYELAEPLTISRLLAALEIDPRRVAVEHNLVIVKRATYDAAIVRPGDQVEIVNFVGGG